MKSAKRSSALVLAVSLGLASCTATSVPLARPTSPAGWTTIEGGSADLRFALPPWLVAFDTTGAVFANVPGDASRPGFLQLLAEGPRTAEPQPATGESLEAWLLARIALAGPGSDTITRIQLPAGDAVLIERTVGSGSTREWRFRAYAITTSAGVAYLLIDGPAASWPDREADLRLIPLLMELGPGRA